MTTAYFTTIVLVSSLAGILYLSFKTTELDESKQIHKNSMIMTLLAAISLLAAIHLYVRGMNQFFTFLKTIL